MPKHDIALCKEGKGGRVENSGRIDWLRKTTRQRFIVNRIFQVVSFVKVIMIPESLFGPTKTDGRPGKRSSYL